MDRDQAVGMHAQFAVALHRHHAISADVAARQHPQHAADVVGPSFGAAEAHLGMPAEVGVPGPFKAVARGLGVLQQAGDGQLLEELDLGIPRIDRWNHAVSGAGWKATSLAAGNSCCSSCAP
ncbi:hypothetical protein D3C86_1491160 [compost metagenome]